MKYVPSRDIPEFARELKTVSPSAICELILTRRNEERTPESICWWFKQHSDIKEQLLKEFAEGLPGEKQAIDTTIFQNGSFQELPSIKRWVEVMRARELSDDFVKQKIGNLKNVCRGTIAGHDLVADGKWSLRHPDRLTFNDLLEINARLKEAGVDTYPFKRDIKDFLENVRGIPVGKKITVGKSKSFGKYAELFVEMDVLTQILQGVRSRSEEAYAADLFMFKTATRLSATLNSNIEDFVVLPKGPNYITVFDKGKRSIYPKGHPWKKRIDAQLASVLLPLMKDRKAGKLFSISEHDLSVLNHEMIWKYAPDVCARYPDLSPNHFWRHMFAQHMLRRNDWNYTKVAALGGWTAQALEESYGKPPQEQVEEWGDTAQLNIEVVTA